MRLTTITKRLSITAVALAASCSTIIEPVPEQAQAPKLTALPRALSAAEQRLVSSANDFSFALFRQVASANKDSNVFISPLSASMALGMTMNGASGTTHDQMRTALAFGTSTDSVINESYNGLIGLLRGLDATVDVRVANSIWYEKTFPFNQTFVDDSKRWFDAKVSALDFAQPSSVTTINDWVSTATSGKIPQIIDKISPDQVMLLINAIYFKGNWRDKFDAAQTKDTLFFGVSGNQPMRLMHRHGVLSFLFTPQFAAVDLPYGNGAFTMTVLLPNQGTSLDQLVSSLQSGAWTSWMSGFHEISTDIWLPKLKLEWERTLNGDLKALGLRDAFDPNVADFTRMSPAGRGLYIDKVKQKTYVDINEEGTEAAAVTSVGISVTSLPPSLRVDRPYIFVIRERLSGTIVFMGKIVRMP
ncbi:MAG: serpin family protein [bacterium]